MNMNILNPWNWFKHEESERASHGQVPVQKNAAYNMGLPSAFAPLGDFHREIDQMFDNAFRNFGLPSLFTNSNSASGAFFRPQVDISASDKAYEIVLDVPGMKEDELAIEVQGESLVVRGEKQENKEEKDKHFYRVERSYGTFQRTLALPDDADTDAISAKLKDGVLTLSIQRKKVPENKNAKRIAIS